MEVPAETSRPPGAIAQGIVEIGAGFGKAAAAMHGDSKISRAMRLIAELYQTPIALPWIVPVSGSGVIQPTTMNGPLAGQYWSVRRLTAVGYTAGTVQVFKNGVITGQGATASVVGRNPFTFPQSGLLTLGRGELLLRPNDFLIFLATGITLATGYGGVELDGDADCFSAWLLPEYIG